jgi:deoxyribonuclease-4
MLLGAHESVAGGAFTAIERGRADGCQALQIFARPSSQWRARPFAPDEVSLFRSELAGVGWPVMSHASYLINLSAADPVFLERSRDALCEELARAEELGLDFVVLHPGAHVGAGNEVGVDAAAASLTEVFTRVPGLRVRLLLEITAGQGSCLGCRFEDMAAILDGLGRTRAGAAAGVGICFDTCHAHAAGYDLTTDEGYDGVFAELERRVGLGALAAFHLNDSKTALGSRVDRHQEIGDGTLGLYPFWRLVNDPRFADVPGILETPSGPDKLPSFARNLQRLRALQGAPRPNEPPRPPARTGRGGVPDSRPLVASSTPAAHAPRAAP